MPKLCVILPNQLSLSNSSLQAIDPKSDHVLMAETLDHFTHVKHHQKKIAFILSSMRHFAKALKQKNYQLTYIDIHQQIKTFTDAIQSLVTKNNFTEILLSYPPDYRMLEAILDLESTCKIPIQILEDNNFLCDIETFKDWAGDKKQLRMEFFYRMMRKDHQILMDGNQPIGGKWNFDAQNRKKAPAQLEVPKTYHIKPDTLSLQAIADTKQYFSDHFGDIEPFFFAVTREQALVALKQFIDERLCLFGDYQDAMLQGEPFMFHAHISFYLNCGLLYPLECIQAAQSAYEAHKAPLNAVEGFIRQVLGWREYVRGIYWLKMPQYADLNYLQAKRKLPSFYWDANTDMNCLKQCITETKNNAYAHHIQRLMVLGNFALIAGIDPQYVNEWYLIVYADAYEWVELPNVSGMVLFADGGLLASKPYASSGSYIHKMSNYCKDCAFSVKEKLGEKACPFNYLYWDFLIRNQKALSSNQRLGFMYAMINKMEPSQIKAIQQQASAFLSKVTQ
ncbi:cryptochrome/photolyase family protein [Gammaproteobacteria bacterium]|nr:cryptochrome/photolyase family protein [Gammaproteobacteria bacterium]